LGGGGERKSLKEKKKLQLLKGGLKGGGGMGKSAYVVSHTGRVKKQFFQNLEFLRWWKKEERGGNEPLAKYSLIGGEERSFLVRKSISRTKKIKEIKRKAGDGKVGHASVDEN